MLEEFSLIESPPSSTSNTSSWAILEDSPDLSIQGSNSSQSPVEGPAGPVQNFSARYALLPERLFLTPVSTEPSRVERCMHHWAFRACFALLASLFYLQGVPPLTQELVTDDPMAPAAWDKRYVRTTPTTGYEVFLVRRGQPPLTPAASWIVLTPDRTLKTLQLRDRKTVLNVPTAGSYFAPVGALSAAEKTAVRTAADDKITNQEAFSEVTPYNTDQWSTSRRVFSFLLGMPALGGHGIRWVTRSRYRVFGTAATLLLVYDILSKLAVWEMLEHFVALNRNRFGELIQSWKDASGRIKEFIEALQVNYETLAGWIEPWRLFAYLMVTGFVIYMRVTWDPDSEESPSLASTPATTPPDSPRDGQSNAQMEAIKQIMEKQMQLQEQLILTDEQFRTQTMLQQVKNESTEKSQWSDEDREMFTEMKTRVDMFSKYVTEDKKEINPVPETPAKTVTTSEATSSKDQELQTPEKKEEPPAKKPKTQELEAQVARLVRVGQNPTEICREAILQLEDWSTVDMMEAFPEGFRVRLAPQLLTQIYQSGKKARDFILEWLRVRTLYENPSAREALSVAGTIDTLLLDEKVPNFINKVSTEKLCKKLYALMIAFEHVSKESDWKKPQGSSKWQSKVNWEEARRYDPELKTDNQVPRFRDVEDLVHKEVDREAALIRSKMKLKDHDSPQG